MENLSGDWNRFALDSNTVANSDTMSLSSRRSFLKKELFTETRSSIYSKTLEATTQVQGGHMEVDTWQFMALQQTKQ